MVQSESAPTKSVWDKYPIVKTNQSPNPSSGGILSDIGHFAQGALQSVSDLGQGIANLGDRGINYLFGTHLQAPKGNVFALNPQASNTRSAQAGKIAGQIGAMLAVPVTAEGLLPSLAEGAAQGGAFGALQSANNPNQSILKGAAVGAALGAPGELLGNTVTNYMTGLAGKAAKGIGNLKTPEEMKEFSEIVGQPTDFGSLVGHEGLSNFANKFLPNVGLIPFISNKLMKGSQIKIKNETDSYANDLLSRLIGNSNPEDVTQDLKNAVDNNFELHKSDANQMYGSIARDADDRGIAINDFSNLKNALKEINEEGSLIPENSGFMKKINGLVEQTENNVGKNNATNNIKYNPVHNLSTRANKYSSSRYNTDLPLSRQYGLISTALKKDISNNLMNSGSRDLSDRLEDADSFYENNVAPYYNDSVVRGVINGNKDIESLPNRLTQSQNQNIINHLSLNDSRKLVYQLLKGSKFDDGLGNIQTSPEKLMGAYNKLSDGVKGRVVDPQTQSQFNQLRAQLYTQKALRDSLSPGGDKIEKVIKKGASMLPLAATATISGMSPHLAIPFLLGSNLFARGANKLLRSDALKNAYINGADSGLARTNRLLSLFRYPAISGANNIVQGGQ